MQSISVCRWAFGRACGRAVVRAAGVGLSGLAGWLAGGQRLGLRGTLAAAALAGAVPGAAQAQCVWFQTPTTNTVQLCAGGSLTLTAVAIAPGTYTWRRDGVFVGTGQTLTLDNLQPSATGTYVCTFVSSTAISCSISTAGTPVIVRAAPVISSQPTGGFYCEGETLTLSVGVNNSTGAAFRWRQSNQVLSNGGRVSGADTPTLTITGLTAADQALYTCDILGPCGNAFTSIANVQVGAQARVTAQPRSVTVCAGGSASFSVAATGAGLSYSWQYLRAGQWTTLTDGDGVSGSSTATLTLSPVAASQNGWALRCQVIGTCNTAVSGSALLTVNAPVSGSVSGPSAWCRNSTLEVRAEVQGTATAFRWFRDGQRLSDGSGVSGSSTAVLRITGAPVGLSTYSVEVDGLCGPMFSAGRQVEVSGQVLANLPSVTRVVCPGGTAVMSVSATGGSLTYRWYRNGVALPIGEPGGRISGADAPTMTISNFQESDVGLYSVRVRNACGMVPSPEQSVGLARATAMPDLPNLTFASTGTPTVMTVGDASGAPGGRIFQWQRNGEPVASGGRFAINTTGTQSTLTINPPAPEDFQAEFRCLISLECGPSVMSSVTRVVAAGFAEVEPNDSDGLSNTFSLPPGTVISGTTTGDEPTIGPGSLDSFIISLPTLPGIHRYTLTNATGSGHHLSLRGFLVRGGAVTDTFTSLTTPSTGPLAWYTLGTAAPAVRVRVTGTSATTDLYALGVQSEPVTPLNLPGGPLSPGAITFSTVGVTGPTQIDTDLWIYDANLNAIRNAGNDDAENANGGSALTRTLEPGEYTLAVSRHNLAVPRPSPFDDSFSIGSASPNAGTLIGTSPTPAPTISVRITDAAGQRLVPMPVEQAYGVAFLRFTVGTAACSIADVVAVGGAAPGDGLLTGDDFIAFINAFSTGESLADVVAIGGTPPGDGLITGDDFNAFIAAFAQGCP